MKTEVKERPILFSGPMVRAILAGRKTQTRRIVKNVFKSDSGTDCIKDWDGLPSSLEIAPHDWELCPHGVPGDRLWVRETFCPLVSEHFIGDQRFAYRATTDADGERCRQDYVDAGYDYRWRPSIHMPRKACRITLDVSQNSVQRTQSITDDDSVAEGIERNERGHWRDYTIKTGYPYRSCLTPRDSFQSLWTSINGKQSWSDNPWVWVVKFPQYEAPNNAR